LNKYKYFPPNNDSIGISVMLNRFVHDYMNVDMTLVFALIEQQDYQFIVEFLREPISIQQSS